MDIELIAVGHYCLRTHSRVITVSAQDLCELADWCRLHSEQLEQEAKSSLHAEVEAEGWSVEDEPYEEDRLHLLRQESERKRLRKLAHSLQVEASEPWLQDCPYCRGAHTAGTIEQCPLNPASKPITAYQAMEAALQLLTGNILNMRTDLLAIKALLAKNSEQEEQT